MSDMIVHSRLCSNFPDLLFGMSTRKGGVSPEPLGMNLSFNVGDDPRNVEENRARFFGAMAIPQSRLAFPKQIHSGTVRTVREPGMYADCDALVTATPGIFLAVSIADCVPVFLFEPVIRSVAAVHSGWRGSKQRILAEAEQTMHSEYGANSADMLAFIGPCAGGCCYEVGEEVASQFNDEFVIRDQGKKPHLDLKAFNRALLIASGLKEENIEVSPDCTICNTLYHSYRRDGARSGRMYGVIGFAEEAAGVPGIGTQ
jgi:YfiH family protein